MVVAGSGRVRLDDEIREIRQWDVVRVAPEVVRGHPTVAAKNVPMRVSASDGLASARWTEMASQPSGLPSDAVRGGCGAQVRAGTP